MATYALTISAPQHPVYTSVMVTFNGCISREVFSSRWLTPVSDRYGTVHPWEKRKLYGIIRRVIYQAYSLPYSVMDDSGWEGRLSVDSSYAEVVFHDGLECRRVSLENLILISRLPIGYEQRPAFSV